jgi:mRNA interferase RelE/StbE
MGNEIRVDLGRSAEKFLKRHPSQIREEDLKELIRKAVRKLTHEEMNNSDVREMKGALKGYYRLRIGDIRIMFKFEGKAVRIVRVYELDFRGNIYL